MLSVPKDKVAVLRYRYVSNTGYVLDTEYSENALESYMLVALVVGCTALPTISISI